TRSSNTVLGSADQGKLIKATAAFTQTFAAAATLGNGGWIIIKNASTDGTTILTLDPNGAETIDGLTTVKMYSGETRLIECDGTNFISQILQGGFALFTASGNFTVPPGVASVWIDAIGAGGGGGAGQSGGGGTIRKGGAGGGGGARIQAGFPGSALGAPGTNIAVK